MLTCLAATVLLHGSGALATLDWAVLDRAAGRVPADAPVPVVLVAIDDDSIERFGRWPWPRDRVAQLLERLVQAGAAPIAIDLLLPDRAIDDPQGDRRLAAAIAAAPVLLPVPAVDGPAAQAMAKRIVRLWPAALLVHSDVEFEPGSAVRLMHRSVQFGTVRLPALASALTGAPGAVPASVLAGELDQVGAAVPDWRRTDPLLLHLGAGLARVDRLSAADLLDGRVDPARLRGRPTVVGVSASGLSQAFLVPARAGGRQVLQGVELSAAAAAALADGQTSALLPAAAQGLPALTTALVASAVLVVARWRWLLPVLPLLLLLPLAISWGLRSAWAWAVPMASASGGILVAFVVLLLLRFLAAQRRLRTARADLDLALTRPARTVIALDAAGRMLFASDPAAVSWPGLGDGALRHLLDDVRRHGARRNARLRGMPDDTPAAATLAPAVFAGSPGFLLVLGPANDGAGCGPADPADELDLVCGLPSRHRLWADLLGIAAEPADAGRLALVLVAIDGFRRINEALGPAEGDAALRQAATVLRQAFAPPAALYRWDGDQFAVVTRTATDADDAGNPARVVHDLFAQGRICHRDMVLRASVGAAFSAAGADEVLRLVQRAERALAEVKRFGGSHWRQDSGSSGWTMDQLEEERQIRLGVQEDQFFLRYQPVVDARSGSMVRLEALLRWQHPERGELSPAQFLAVAEAAALEIDLGRVAVAHVLADTSGMAGQGLRVPVSLNVSARHFERECFLEDMRPLADARGRAGFLVEITESVALRDPDRAARIAVALAAMGIGVSLDDLLNGHSSLALLRSLRVSEIKLAGDLVAGAVDEADASVLVRAIIELGRNLGIDVVAEGVETPQQSQWLLSAGCPLQQGYLFCHPERWQRLPAWARPPTRPAAAP